MKVKSAVMILLSMVLLLGLFGCGADNGAVQNGNGLETGAISKYNIDVDTEGEQPMSDRRATEDTLKQTYHTWYQGMDSAVRSGITYDDLVKEIGMDPSAFQHSGSYRMYIWVAEGDSSIKLHATFREEDGRWVFVSLNGNNIGAAL